MIWEISWFVAEVARLWIIILEEKIFHTAQRSSFLIKVQTDELDSEDHWTFVQKFAMINMTTFLTGWMIEFIGTLDPTGMKWFCFTIICQWLVV